MAPSAARAQEGGDVFRNTSLKSASASTAACNYLIGAQEEDGTFPDQHGTSTGISSLVGMTYPQRGRRSRASARTARPSTAASTMRSRTLDEDGLIDCGDHGNGPMYAHNISALFLSAMFRHGRSERQKKIDAALAEGHQSAAARAGSEKRRKPAGGWRYHPAASDSDLSCSGWALMALRSARLNGAPVPTKAIDAAVRYVHRSQKRARPLRLQDTTSTATRSPAPGLLCLDFADAMPTPGEPQGRRLDSRNITDLPRNQFEFYGNYYNAQGMFQLGGKYWKTLRQLDVSPFTCPSKSRRLLGTGHFGRTYSTASWSWP